MRAWCTTSCLGRAAALVVALVLSGGLPLAAAPADHGDHRCHCRHAPGERCSCSRCRRASTEARRARLAEVPPCHRAAAEAELAREERGPGQGVAAVNGCCADPERHLAPTRLEPFVPPSPGALGPAAPGLADRGPGGGPPTDVPRAPPAPPPRLA